MVTNNLTGKSFGRLTVLNRAGSSKNGHALWQCACACGNTTVVFGSNLIREHTTSCGCVNTEVITKHGLYHSGNYQTYRGMLQRCYNPKAKHYKNYGGRGITICEEWLNSFEKFYEDMGPRPGKEYSIDRIDNNKGYFKENCRWATADIQANNKRQRKKVAKCQ